MQNRFFNKNGNSNKSANKDYRKPRNDVETSYIMYGKHPVLCAIKNPNRKIYKIYASKNSNDFLRENLGEKKLASLNIEILDPTKIDRLFDKYRDSVVHQGLAAEVESFPQKNIEEIAENYTRIVAIDKITDPHNIGAIIRSCAAFGAGIVITKDKESPPENATIAKTSAGLIENVAYCRLQSLQNSLEYLKKQGFQIIGLSGNSEENLKDLKSPKKFVLVTGSEGKGLSPNIESLCDTLVKIEMSPQVESLNASVATAIALYSLN